MTGDPLDGVELSEQWAASGQPEGSAVERTARYRHISRQHQCAVPPRTWVPATREKTGTRARRALAAMFVIVVAAAGAAAIVQRPDWLAPSQFTNAQTVGETPAPPATSAQRILPRVRVPRAPAGSYAIAHTHPDGSPVGFSPCERLSVVVNTDLAPPHGYQTVAAAVSEVQAATGLQIVVEGFTDEPVTHDREPRQPDRYGDRWAPILVGWASSVDHGAAGTGGPILLSDSTGRHAVSGTVVLDAYSSANSDPRLTKAVLLHEFGHVIGLSHVSDRGQLMYPVSGQLDYGAGDREGLARLGDTPCR